MRTAYKLEDVRLWDIEQARFINPSALALENYGKQNLEIKVLVNSTGEADVPYIIKMLEFYGYPLGELAKDSPEGIK